MPTVTLGQIISDSQNGDILGITDRPTIIRYIQRAYELASAKANWNPQLGTIDICSDSCGYVTLPSWIEAPLAVNVNGSPAYFRNSWFEYHINGPGERCYGGSLCSYVWDDRGPVPAFQDITEWSCLAALVENPADGNGSLFLTVRAVTVDSNYNEKEVTLQIPLLLGYASTDPNITQVKKILQVSKPVTQGYVKLIAFPPKQLSTGKVIGYYEPNETDPRYRRIKLNSPCSWARVRYRRSLPPLVYDYDVIPLSSSQAMIELLKSIRYSDSGDIQTALMYEQHAVELLQEFQAAQDGPGTFALQVDPGFGAGTYDWR